MGANEPEQKEEEAMAREDLLAQTFVQLADSLVDDFDIIDLLTVLADRCVELVDADAVGILVADADGNLRVMAASSEQVRLLELFQLPERGRSLPRGPRHRVSSSSTPTSGDARRAVAPIRSGGQTRTGFASVYACCRCGFGPVVIGALNLFRRQTGAMPAADVEPRPGPRRRRQHRHPPERGHP